MDNINVEDIGVGDILYGKNAMSTVEVLEKPRWERNRWRCKVMTVDPGPKRKRSVGEITDKYTVCSNLRGGRADTVKRISIGTSIGYAKLEPFRFK